LQKNTSPNSLLVDDSVADDHSTIAIHPEKLSELNLIAGDTVLLKGKKRKTTLAVINADENVPFGKITMSKIARSNLR